MRIACVGDLHYSNLRWRSSRLQRINNFFYQHFFKSFFSIEADLYVCLGDLTHFGTPGELKQIFSIIQENKRPDQVFEPVIGNHDILFSKKRIFQKISGLESLYRAKDADEWRLIFLDTARVNAFRKDSSYMGIAQSRWLCDELMESLDRPVMIFAHHPADQVTMTDQDRRYLINLSLVDVLKIKSDTAVYVNGHKHRNKFHVEDNWAFLQFNDILDDPAIRVLELDGRNVKMETISFQDPEMINAASKIAAGIITFVRQKRKGEFADVDDLKLYRALDDDTYRLDLSYRQLSTQRIR